MWRNKKKKNQNLGINYLFYNYYACRLFSNILIIGIKELYIYTNILKYIFVYLIKLIIFFN